MVGDRGQPAERARQHDEECHPGRADVLPADRGRAGHVSPSPEETVEVEVEDEDGRGGGHDQGGERGSEGESAQEGIL